MKKYFYKCPEEVQELIDSDSTIKYRSDMLKKYPGLYDLCYRKGWMKCLKFPMDDITKRWGNIKSINDVQKIIDSDAEIISKESFRLKYPGLYTKSVVKNWLSSLVFLKSINYLSWKNIISIEDLSNFIKTNKVESRKDLLTRFPGLYNKSIRTGWIEHITFLKERYKWENMSLKEVQDFIDSDKDIINLETLKKKYSGLFSYIKRKKFDIIFKSVKKSSWEIKLKNFLELKIKKEFLEDKKSTFSAFSKLDLFLEEFNLAIEIQGPYHWRELNKHENFLKIRKSDLKKNHWCRENGIKLYYFSYGNEYAKYGYPYYIYTSEKELLNDILSEINKKNNR